MNWNRIINCAWTYNKRKEYFAKKKWKKWHKIKHKKVLKKEVLKTNIPYSNNYKLDYTSNGKLIRNRKWYLMNYWKYKLNEVKKRNIQFDLNFDEFCKWHHEVRDRCYYCHHSLKTYRFILKTINLLRTDSKYIIQLKDFYFKNRSKIYYFLQIDRKHNHIGYNINNIVKACWICNRNKFTQPYSESLLKRLKEDSRQIYEVCRKEIENIITNNPKEFYRIFKKSERKFILKRVIPSKPYHLGT